jgi:hypothetical protein
VNSDARGILLSGSITTAGNRLVRLRSKPGRSRP